MKINRTIHYICVSFLILFVIIVSIIVISNNWLIVKSEQIRINGLPARFEGMKIVHLTDLHGVTFGKDQIRLLKKIESISPDITVFTGDLVDDKMTELDPIISFMENLVMMNPTYFVGGNHDYHADYLEITTRLSEVGVSVLENIGIKLEKDDQHIWLVGIGDSFSGHDDLHGALQYVNTQCPVILLSHTPEMVYPASEQGVDLVLAGHNHGGQIRLPFLKALYAPGGQLFPYFDSGLYKVDQTYLYLSRGLGYTGILPFRFWNPPEIIVIVLQQA